MRLHQVCSFTAATTAAAVNSADSPRTAATDKNELLLKRVQLIMETKKLVYGDFYE
jgi:hypothetical protein